jgi:hypothetical protein
MAVTKWLAEDLTAEINTGTEGAPVWTEIKGLNSIAHAPSTQRADATDFNSEGREEHLPVRRGDSFTLGGFALEDAATGDQDPGQEAVEALAREVGTAGIGQFRFTTAGSREFTFKASAQVTAFGGGNNDLSTWSAELVVTGGITVA